jgi:hypothetical protein
VDSAEGSYRTNYNMLINSSRDSSAVSRWSTGWMIGGSSPSRGWKFFSSPPGPDWVWARPASYPMGTRGSFPGGQVAGA